MRREIKKHKVVALLNEGLTSPEVAERLGVSREYVRATAYRNGVDFTRVIFNRPLPRKEKVRRLRNAAKQLGYRLVPA